MANTIQLRRSAVASAVPTTTQLALGELAINTYDGKLYLKKNNGTESIVEIGAGGASSSKDYFTFGGTGTPAAGTAITPYIRVMNSCTCVNASLTAKIAPSGGNFVVSILRSSDNGATFPTTVATITTTTGNRVGTTTTTTALSAGDLLRLDITSVNGATDWTAQLYTSG